VLKYGAVFAPTFWQNYRKSGVDMFNYWKTVIKYWLILALNTLRFCSPTVWRFVLSYPWHTSFFQYKAPGVLCYQGCAINMLQNGAHLVLCYKAVWSNTVRLVSCVIKAAPLICLNTNIRRLSPCAIKDVPLIWTKGASCVLCYQGWATNLVPYGVPGALCYRGCAKNLIQNEMPGVPVLSRLCH
jgi:hypothetical protein